MYKALLASCLIFGAQTPQPVPINSIEGESDVGNSIEGSYVARTMNGGALPAELRVPVTQGDFRLFRLEQGVLTLGGDGHFTLHFRYYHQLVLHGQRPTTTPVLSDSETGTFHIQAGKLTLTPTRKKGRKARRPVTATMAGDEIKATYMLENGSGYQRVSLTLRRDPTFW